MKIWLGMAVVAVALAPSGPAAVAAAQKSPQAKSQAGKSNATDLSAHRPHYRHGYRPHNRPYYTAYDRPYPTYYARPVSYRPAYYRYIGYPPALFSFNVGVGFGPYWW
jgi:hypothetical protein